MKRLGIGMLVAVIAAVILTVPVLAKNHGTPPGAGGFGVVDGHLEGANPVAARVCVDYENDGFVDKCEAMVRPDTTGIGMTIPKHFVATATFSAWAGPDLGDLEAAVDSLSGTPCAAVPIADAGMMLCQDPRANVVKRVNVYWTANSANGARDTRGDDGTGR